MTEKRLAGRTCFQGRVFDVEVDEVELDGGRRAEREVVRHPGGVAVLAVDDQNRAVMVRQFRYAAGREMLEIPAGRLEAGEEPQAAGLRELREETGYRAAQCDSLGEIIPTGGYCTERIYLYLARGLTLGETSPDDGEFVEPLLMPLETLRGDILQGRINDAKTAVAVMRGLDLLERLPPAKEDAP